MVSEEILRSPGTELRSEASPQDIVCPGGTVDNRAGSRCDECGEGERFESWTKYGDKTGDERGMNVVSQDDMIDEQKYGVSTSIDEQVKGNNTPLLPSSGRSVQHEKAGNTGAAEKVTLQVNKCLMRKMKCVTHDCNIERVKEKVKAWGYIDKKKMYGWKYSTKSRLICKSGLETSSSDSGLARDVVTGEISDRFSLGGKTNNGELLLEESENVVQNGAI